MPLELSIGGLKKLTEGVLETSLEPQEVRRLGSTASSVGAVSVVCVGRGTLAADGSSIRFTPEAANVLNVGTTSRTLVILEREPASVTNRPPLAPSDSRPDSVLRDGDRAFVAALSQLPESVREAGISILRRVRANFPGQLLAASSRRFQETPDNFWFVTIQPRDRSLVITVRGLPNRFNPRRLNIVADRSPYSRFKVRGPADVEEAADVILHAIRK